MIPEISKLHRIMIYMIRNDQIDYSNDEKCKEINDSLLSTILSIENEKKQNLYYERALEDYLELFIIISHELDDEKFSLNKDIRYYLCSGYHELTLECKKHGIYVSPELMERLSRSPAWESFRQGLSFAMIEEFIVRIGEIGFFKFLYKMIAGRLTSKDISKIVPSVGGLISFRNSSALSKDVFVDGCLSPSTGFDPAKLSNDKKTDIHIDQINIKCDNVKHQ